MSQNNLTYLDIDDAYIHKLFPLLQDQQIEIPNYFGEGSVGAHITVIYPEEGKKVNEEDLNQEHHFFNPKFGCCKNPQKNILRTSY